MTGKQGRTIVEHVRSRKPINAKTPAISWWSCLAELRLTMEKASTDQAVEHTTHDNKVSKYDTKAKERASSKTLATMNLSLLMTTPC